MRWLAYFAVILLGVLLGEVVSTLRTLASPRGLGLTGVLFGYTVGYHLSANHPAWLAMLLGAGLGWWLNKALIEFWEAYAASRGLEPTDCENCKARAVYRSIKRNAPPPD